MARRYREIKWCASDLHAANHCLKRWQLEEIERIPTDRISAFAKGDIVHRLIEGFQDWKSNKIGRDKKYQEKTRGQFIEFAGNKWKQQIVAAEHGKRPIVWNYDNEKWVMLYQIEALAGPIYDMLLRERRIVLPPEYSYDFLVAHIIDGKQFEIRYNGKIDEVYLDENGRPVVRDYKTGKQRTGDMKLGWDPQPTMYCLALSVLAHQNKEFARCVGLEDEAPYLLQPDHFLSKHITFEYCLLEDMSIDRLSEKKTRVDLVKQKIAEETRGNIHAEISIARTHREDRHYFAMLEGILKIRDIFERGAIRYERGEKCDFCPIRNACLKQEEKEKDLAKNKPGVQQVLSFFKPAYSINPKPEKVSIKQRRLNWATARKKAEKRAEQSS